MASGDNPAWANPDIDDRNWTPVNPVLDHDSAGYKLFTGIAWFRLHFEPDSSISQYPVALVISHLGASKVYLDGQLLNRPQGFGDFVETYEKGNPRLQPYVLNLSPGPHLLAVRYEYPDFKKDQKRYSLRNVGFELAIDEAASYLDEQQTHNFVITAIVIALFTLFFTLAVIHFFHYAYYRIERSNLLFSLFNLCIAYCLGTAYLTIFPLDSDLALEFQYWVYSVVTLAAISFSGFINELFGARRRFYFIAALGLCANLIHFWFKDFGMVLLALLVFTVSLEGVILITRAILKGVKGARIIGAGMLLMASLVLLLFVGGVLASVMSDGNLYINGGAIYAVILGIAVVIMPLSMSAFLAWNFARVNKDLKTQLVQVNRLSDQNLAQEQEKQRILASRGEELEKEVALRTEELRGQKQKSDDLLRNILPEQVAEELKENGKYEARLFEQVSVLFTDFVDFTQVAEKLSPAELIHEIDDCFQAFDKIIEQHGLEKIKTVGDAYIAVAGLPSPREDHALAVVRAAMEIRSFVEGRLNKGEGRFSIRIGVHSGPVVAGIVGLKKFAYDIWGDTVNTAARMEQHGEAGKINISSETHRILGDAFLYTYRGALDVKHKGKLDMYFVEVPRVNASTVKP